MEALNWQFAAACLATAAFIGRLLDAALHRTMTPVVRERLFAYAVRLDEWSYVEILHGDAEKALEKINWVFGDRPISVRLLVVSASVPLLLVTFPEAQQLSNLPLLVILNVLLDQASLILTRNILVAAQDKTRSLILLFALDSLIAIVFMSLPLAIYANEPLFDTFPPLQAYDQNFSSQNEVVIAINHLMIPWLIVITFAGLFDKLGIEITGIFPVVWTFVIFLSAALPTLIHIYYLATDLSKKMLVRPACKFLSGIAEYASDEKLPLTWIFTTLGAIPVLVKLWSLV